MVATLWPYLKSMLYQLLRPDNSFQAGAFLLPFVYYEPLFYNCRRILSSSSRDTHWHTSLALQSLRAEHSEFLIDSLPFRSTGSLGSTCCQRTPMQARLRACSLLDIFFVLHNLISKHGFALRPGVYLFNETSHWNNSFHCILVFVEEREQSL